MQVSDCWVLLDEFVVGGLGKLLVVVAGLWCLVDFGERELVDGDDRRDLEFVDPPIDCGASLTGHDGGQLVTGGHFACGFAADLLGRGHGGGAWVWCVGWGGEGFYGILVTFREEAFDVS